MRVGVRVSVRVKVSVRVRVDVSVNMSMCFRSGDQGFPAGLFGLGTDKYLAGCFPTGGRGMFQLIICTMLCACAQSQMLVRITCIFNFLMYVRLFLKCVYG